MKIYTKKGDTGTTGLFGGGTVSKAALRVEAYGTVDELNSALGVARLHRIDDPIDAQLGDIQSRLFDVGAELATSPDYGKDIGIPLVSEADIEKLEHAIDAATDECPPLKVFVLPAGSASAAHLHVARTVCRRAERRVVELHEHEPVRLELVRYLNRLSDLLFTWARLANQRAGVGDVPWVGRGK